MTKLAISAGAAVILVLGLLYRFELFPQSFYNYKLVTEWGSFGYAEEDGKFQLPYGSTIYKDRSGEEFLLITDCHNHNVQKFDLKGNFISKFGEEGNGEGQLNTPADIAVSRDGNIWVVEERNDRVSKFDMDGKFIQHFSITTEGVINGEPAILINILDSPLSVAFNSKDEIYISNYGNNLVMQFDKERNFKNLLNKHDPLDDLNKISQVGSEKAQFNSPYYLAIDSKDNVYVTDRGNNRIQKFSPDGEFLLKWGKNGGDGTAGDGNGEFDFPHEIAVDKNDNVYVADTMNKRVQVFDSRGNFLFKLGGEEVFVTPKIVAVDNDLNIYIGDAGHRALEGEDSLGHEHEPTEVSDIKITKWKKSFFLSI